MVAEEGSRTTLKMETAFRSGKVVDRMALSLREPRSQPFLIRKKVPAWITM